MENRNLGKTNLKISPIGLGTWQFSEGQGFHKYFWNKINQNTANEIVKVSIKQNVNWFDTAEIYGNGRSERAVSKALTTNQINNKSNIIIATKWSPIMRRASSIMKTFPNRQENLSPYPIDLLQIHNPYSFSSIKSQMQNMANLVNENKIKAIGVSNFSTNKMIKAHAELENFGTHLSSNQVKYSIFDRRIEKKLIDKAKELDITIIAYSPLAQGLATGIYHRNPELIKKLPFFRKRLIKKNLKKITNIIKELEQISSIHSASISQIALNWLINYNDNAVVAIPGATKAHHAEENAKAMNIVLSSEELQAISDLTESFI